LRGRRAVNTSKCFEEEDCVADEQLTRASALKKKIASQTST
jgi:hypothetical protein